MLIAIFEKRLKGVLSTTALRLATYDVVDYLYAMPYITEY